LISKDNEVLEKVVPSTDGPIDASYKAIDQIVGKTFILEDFVINSVTGGTDAQGEVNVKIRNGEKVYHGYGVSLDIVEASILAYVSAINSMLYDQEKQKEV
jgi:2-isopropylmalate synthase